MSELTRAPRRDEDNPASRRRDGAAACPSGRPQPSKHTPMSSGNSPKKDLTPARGLSFDMATPPFQSWRELVAQPRLLPTPRSAARAQRATPLGFPPSHQSCARLMSCRLSRNVVLQMGEMDLPAVAALIGVLRLLLLGPLDLGRRGLDEPDPRGVTLSRERELDEHRVALVCFLAGGVQPAKREGV